MASFRLNKVAKDFNVGIQTLVEYLAKKGHQVEATPTRRLARSSMNCWPRLSKANAE